MIARLGLRPMMIGNTNVAPNMAMTCWAPSPVVLPQLSRCCGATGSPGAGSTRSHLNIDIAVLLALGRPPAAILVVSIRHRRWRNMPEERRTGRPTVCQSGSDRARKEEVQSTGEDVDPR